MLNVRGNNIINVAHMSTCWLRGNSIISVAYMSTCWLWEVIVYHVWKPTRNKKVVFMIDVTRKDDSEALEIKK